MDYREIAKAARKQGWREDARQGKTVWFSPDGKTTVTWHHTVSDHYRAVKNFLSRMRQGGLQWPPPK
jgi:hypothetical protein